MPSAAALLLLLLIVMTITANPTLASQYTAAVLGSTGATGIELVRRLLHSEKCGKVVAYVRAGRPVDSVKQKWFKSPFPTIKEGEIADSSSKSTRTKTTEELEKKLTIVEVDFERLADAGTTTETKDFSSHPIEVAFCALGTTRRDAGSAEKFTRIDHDYVLASAAGFRRNSATRHFAYVSSQGANPSSPFLYPWSKGRTEEGLKALAFPSLSLFRPGLLLVGEEGRESPARWLEGVLQSVARSSVVRSVLPENFKGTSVEVVADAMVVEYEERRRGATGEDSGAVTYESAQVRRMRERYPSSSSSL